MSKTAAALAVLGLAGCAALTAACRSASPDVVDAPAATTGPLNASVAKWHNGHAAAVSINYDAPLFPWGEPDINGYVMDQGLVLGYELVTGSTYWGQPLYSGPKDARLVYLFENLIPNGFGYFGHGHDHIDHDILSYEDALESFKANYETMEDWGLKPVAYSYPRNAGQDEETQRALEASGFLSGRLQTYETDRFYNVPGDSKAPDDWFALMAVPMQSIEFETETFEPCEECVNDNTELDPILDEALNRTAWIILVYHNIGNPQGFGWYDWDEFQKDVRSIAERDFWVAPMNDITLYVRERQRASVQVEVFGETDDPDRIEMTVSDGLDNVVFDQPLTVLFDLPVHWAGEPFTVAQDGEQPARHVFDATAARVSLKPNERPYVLRK